MAVGGNFPISGGNGGADFAVAQRAFLEKNQRRSDLFDDVVSWKGNGSVPLWD